MVAIWSKIPPPAQWLNSKATGIAVASVAAGILVLWKKKLDDLSRKRYCFAFDANIMHLSSASPRGGTPG